MNPAIWLCILLPLFLLVLEESYVGRIRSGRVQRRRKGSGRMNELIQQFLRKQCILYIGGGWGSNLTGTIEAIEGNWVSVRTKSGVELVNLDYINRIGEVPEKKKKSE